MQELLEVPPLKWPTSKFVYLPTKKENSSRLKKKAATEKDFAMQWSTTKQATNFDVVVVGKICGETFGPVRFQGAGCGSGCGLRAGKILLAQRGLIFPNSFTNLAFSCKMGQRNRLHKTHKMFFKI